MNNLKIFSGTANPNLTRAICQNLGVAQGKLNVKQFADGELFVEIGENVRGADVFVVQPTCAPANDHLMELILTVDALKRASADRVTAVLSYYGYARQDRKDRPRVPISARVVADMLEAVGVDRVLVMDLHSAPIGGFFSIPVDHLYALPAFIEWIKQNLTVPDLTIVSPDAGGVARARLLSVKLNRPMAIIDKNREAANVSEVMHVIGDVKDQNCLMVDDMIDTAGTLCKGATALMERGARSVRAMASHGLFSYDHKEDISAIDKIENSPLVEVIVTNTIPQSRNIERILRDNVGSDETKVRTTSKIKAISVAPLFASGIHAIHADESISGLFV